MEETKYSLINAKNEIFAKTAVDFDAYCMFLQRVCSDLLIYAKVNSSKALPVDVKELLSLHNFDGGEEFSQKLTGINIVVYDKVNSELIDSVCFDLLGGAVYRDGKRIGVLQDVNLSVRQKKVEQIIKQLKENNANLAKNFYNIVGDNIAIKKDFFQSLPNATGLPRLKQMILLYQMRVLDDICRKQDIKYTICAGALLGAFRCGEFVPWDDDIDIIMSSSELLKLIKFCDDNQFDDGLLAPTVQVYRKEGPVFLDLDLNQ
jgi:hypothetical protein